MFTYRCTGHQCVQTHKSFLAMWLSSCSVSHRWRAEHLTHAFQHGVFTLHVGVGQHDTDRSSPNLAHSTWLLPVKDRCSPLHEETGQALPPGLRFEAPEQVFILLLQVHFDPAELVLSLPHRLCLYWALGLKQIYRNKGFSSGTIQIKIYVGACNYPTCVWNQGEPVRWLFVTVCYFHSISFSDHTHQYYNWVMEA